MLQGSASLTHASVENTKGKIATLVVKRKHKQWMKQK